MAWQDLAQVCPSQYFCLQAGKVLPHTYGRIQQGSVVLPYYWGGGSYSRAQRSRSCSLSHTHCSAYTHHILVFSLSHIHILTHSVTFSCTHTFIQHSYLHSHPHIHTLIHTQATSINKPWSLNLPHPQLPLSRLTTGSGRSSCRSLTL